jgi:hypothetical protein
MIVITVAIKKGPLTILVLSVNNNIKYDAILRFARYTNTIQFRELNISRISVEPLDQLNKVYT